MEPTASRNEPTEPDLASGPGQPVTGTSSPVAALAPSTGMTVRVFETSQELGRAAASHTAQVLCAAVERYGVARMIMASGNSQLEFVRSLGGHPEVPWTRVTVFHMDEYIGISAAHPASFARWLREKVGDRLQPGQVHYIRGDAPDVDEECERYEKLLQESPIALTCMGIGENCHIAFNEPRVTDFNDDRWLRATSLDEVSRLQQVGEGHFATVEDVPTRAVTLTVPALLSATEIQVVVPGPRKADAVWRTLHEDVSPNCPASILRLQRNAILFLDADSAGTRSGETDL